MTDYLTDAEADELGRLEQAATPGPWGLGDRGCARSVRLKRQHSTLGSDVTGRGLAIVFDAEDGNDADAALLAAMRNALPALLARARRCAELEAHVRKWPTLECPCCGEEGAWAAYFQDGQETTCGCGGIVSADGEGAHILIDEEDCQKCKETQ